MEQSIESVQREGAIPPETPQKNQPDQPLSQAQSDEKREANSGKAKTKKTVKEFFSARKIATLAVFTALAFVVSLFDFPIFPAASFLKLDFGNVFIMLMGFVFGPVEAFIVCVIKELIHIPLGSTGGIGELANICMTTAYILIPSTVYYFKKGIKVVIPSLIAGIILQTAMALICNRFITFPLYMGEGAESAFNSLFYIIIYFNLIKGAAISVICILLYKHLSKVLSKLKIK
jgi:riboflavin transporter FmnP